MLEPAIVVPGPWNNTLYNFKVTARQRVISQPRKEHVTYYVVCEVWRGAILLSHRLFAGDLGLIMTGAAAISGNDLAAALYSYHSYLYIHHFIFSSFVYSTRSTHIYRLLDLLLCYWMYFAISMWMSDVKISFKLKSLSSGYGKGYFNVSAVSLISW